MNTRPFSYVTVRKKHIARIEREGLPSAVTTFGSLKKARAVKGRVLVVPSDKLESGSVRPRDIPNLKPYRRAVPIVAGGGVLIRKGKGGAEVVLIYRKGRWDLPKGKRDRGEGKRACAIREVQEELGIADVHPLSKLGTTVHGYRARKRRYIVKTTHWWAMTTSATSFIPQAKERITDARWVPLDRAIKKLDYGVLRRLLKENREQLRLLAKLAKG